MATEPEKLRTLVLSEIKRLAASNGNTPPGVERFVRETGITEARWRGVVWARWSDALTEAGFSPNSFNQRYDSEFVMRKLAEAARHYGRFPTVAEMSLYKRIDPECPDKKVFSVHFGTRDAQANALLRWCERNEEYRDVAAFLPSIVAQESGNASRSQQEGWVYLISSGSHYKIGRSEEIERRINEIRPRLPEAAEVVHVIRTDDPAGIEAYWHRRFADRRANGEWFKLAHDDVAAFKRRKYQ